MNDTLEGKDEFDYLLQNADVNVLKNLTAMAEHLKGLKLRVLQTEEEYKSAKKELEYYSSSVMPVAMHNAGLEELKLASGGRLSVNRQFYCSPNKNAVDRKLQSEWLKEHGGEHLVKEAAQVQDVDALKEAGIAYSEILDMNTTSLKAFLKDLLGYNSGTAQIELTDIPDSFHFQEVSTVEIDV